jgi:iron(III) transport system substrate-binding protein
MYQAKKGSRLILIAMAAALMGITASAAAAPNYYPKDYDKIIEASRAEKGLYIYSNVSTDNWKPILAVFSKLYPWINIKLLDLGGSEVLPRYIAESETGTPTADFLITQSAPGWARLLGEKRLLRYSSPEIPHLPTWSSQQETVYSFSADPSIMLWNTKIFPADMIPKGMADFAEKVQKKPEFFRGRLTSYNEAAFGGYSAFGLYKHHGEKFWTSSGR